MNKYRVGGDAREALVNLLLPQPGRRPRYLRRRLVATPECCRGSKSRRVAVSTFENHCFRWENDFWRPLLGLWRGGCRLQGSLRPITGNLSEILRPITDTLRPITDSLRPITENLSPNYGYPASTSN